MLPTLEQVLADFLMDRTEFTNLHRHGHFTTKFNDGFRFELSRQNVLEIGFMGALRCVGFKPSVAQREVKTWLQQERTGKLAEMWAANPRLPAEDSLGVGYDDRSTSFDDMARANPDEFENTGYRDDRPERESARKRAIQIVFIDRAEIVRRVDAMFGGRDR